MVVYTYGLWYNAGMEKKAHPQAESICDHNTRRECLDIIYGKVAAARKSIAQGKGLTYEQSLSNRTKQRKQLLANKG